MELTREEENLLKGEGGESLSTAYRILLAIGEATDAERLIPVRWAHISGANYNTIGDSGVNFLEDFSKDTRVRIRTTINPMGFDKDKPGNLPDRFINRQMNIMKSYEMLGTVPSFTCIPYEIFDIPEKGTAVSFGESNAAIFANSMLGLYSNRESGLSSLASAITGKAPYSSLQIENFRHARVAINTEYDLATELDYGLLGFFIGNTVTDNCVAIKEGKEKIGTINAKALSAGIGTSGSCGMFAKEDGTQQEIISCGREELTGVKEQLHTADEGDLIVLGSPQLGLNELQLITNLVQGKKLKKRCIIFCARSIHSQAKQLGITDQIERSGGEFMCDSCTCLTPLVTRADFDSVITNSVKAAYYLNKSNKLGVALKDLKTIIKEYASYN